ncbi:MAG: GTP-binding protein [Zavarzinia sp.]|nr:GTP-binding protein [Zavarzinia sp.]
MLVHAASFPEARGSGRAGTPRVPPVPLALLTGFLGSGKTTLLNRLLGDDDMKHTLVFVNELGEIPIDHLLMEFVDAETVVTSTGCICCVAPSELAASLDRFLSARERGDVAFDRIVVETTGLADPVPVLTTLFRHPALMRRLRLDSVITALDALNAPRDTAGFAEARRQLAFADRIVVTKRDLATKHELRAAIETLRAHNPAADIVPKPTPAALFGAGLWNPATRQADPARWMRAESYPTVATPHHTTDVSAACLEIDEPIAWDSLTRWLEWLRTEHLAALLRMKGVLHLRGGTTPVAIHGVHDLFHPPLPLPDAPDRHSRIVLITQGTSAATLLAALREFLAAPNDRGHPLVSPIHAATPEPHASVSTV